MPSFSSADSTHIQIDRTAASASCTSGRMRKCRQTAQPLWWLPGRTALLPTMAPGSEEERHCYDNVKTHGGLNICCTSSNLSRQACLRSHNSRKRPTSCSKLRREVVRMSICRRGWAKATDGGTGRELYSHRIHIICETCTRKSLVLHFPGGFHTILQPIWWALTHTKGSWGPCELRRHRHM